MLPAVENAGKDLDWPRWAAEFVFIFMKARELQGIKYA